MGTRLQGPLSIVLSPSSAALACSLRGLLLRSAASEAIDSLEAATELADTEAAGPEGALELPTAAADLLGGAAGSPADDIYVGANVSGNCGASSNSGGSPR